MHFFHTAIVVPRIETFTLGMIIVISSLYATNPGNIINENKYRIGTKIILK
jgi:hypothetical protein